MIAAEEDIEANNKKAIQAGFDAWRDGTGGVFDLLASDAKWTIVGNSPVSRTFRSRQEFLDSVITPSTRGSRAGWCRRFEASMPMATW
jgi:uncharacterized protein